MTPTSSPESDQRTVVLDGRSLFQCYECRLFWPREQFAEGETGVGIFALRCNGCREAFVAWLSEP